PGHRKPDEMVARVVSLWRPLHHAPARRIPRGSRPGRPRPEGILTTPMTPLLDLRGRSAHCSTTRGTAQRGAGARRPTSARAVPGWVGESGSGKSVTALSIGRLIPNPPGESVAGEISFKGRDLLKLDYTAIRDIRGSDISMIFQEPLTSLNPVFKIGMQLMEV